MVNDFCTHSKSYSEMRTIDIIILQILGAIINENVKFKSKYV